VKRILIVILSVLMLCGCSAAPTFETLSDVYNPEAPAQPRKIILELPQNAAAQAISSENGTLYLCDGYEVTQQILPAGDLSKTLRELTGFEREVLTVIETGLTEAARYECAWSAAGEAGDSIGRAAILDDGCYHYCITVMADADFAGELTAQWQQIFASYGLD